MRKNQPDEIDLAAIEWAKQRRMIFGVTIGSKLEPHDRLGKLSCTLGSIREDGEGAGQGGTFQQNFPEVYLGIALDIHRAFQLMPGEQRIVMDLHYVWREIPMGLRLKEAGIEETKYLKTLAATKAFLRGYLAAISAIRPVEKRPFELHRALA